MGKKLRVCVVGGGRIGTIHMDAVQKNQRMKLTYFVDVDSNRRQQIAEEVEGVETFISIHDILDNEEKRLNLDAVIVCSPTATHMDVVMSCLKQKIPVMCEKPLSMNVSEIAEAYSYANENNVPLLCGYQRRHDPSFSALETAIRNGEIGDLRSIRSCSRDNPIPSVNFLKISGGIMHDCASHDIDVLRWLTREDPVEVYAVASAFNSDIRDLDDWDTVLICLKFPSGVIANIDICRHAPYGYDQRIEALGSKGMLQAENRRATSLIRSMENSISIDPNFYSFPQRYRETYALELDHFAAIILDGVTPKVSGDDCVKVAIIADMAHESCKLGKPIKIDYTLR